VVELLQDASTPVVVLVEKAAGMRGRNLRAAEQGQALVGEFFWLNDNSWRLAG
jgi:hypothetical protein